MNNKVLVVIISLGIYLLTAGASYMFFTKSDVFSDVPPPSTTVDGKKGNDYEALVFDQSLPKTEACPLNGQLLSKQQKKWWESHRPLGIMIENHIEARPQSGISFADVVYEAIAEGGITRFMVVYYCNDAGIVGPVRSARTYFLDFISEYGDYPLYVHVGGANTPGPANALGQIEDYGWAQYNDMNQFSIGFPTFRRDEARAGRSVATEHTMYSTTSRLWKVAQERELTEKNEDGDMWDADFVQYSFKDDPKTSERPTSQALHMEFWSTDERYFVDWTYDPTNNVYLRENGGEAHNDRNTKEQIQAKNIIVLYMNESNANDGYENNLHLLYRTKGKGNAAIFMDGKQVKGTWRKDSRTDRTLLFDNTGKEIEFTRGKMWFMIMPLEATVTAN
jgi:hypothetical protein